ncbi:MAG: UbiD family decarboxylase [Desulfocucumaceae bacterium]
MDQISMRQWLATVRELGRLKTVSRPVDPEYELAAVGSKADGQFAVLFNHVEGFRMPVVTGLAGDRELFALALKATPEDMVLKFGRGVENPRPCAVVPNDQAPVKETVVLEGIDLEKFLPAPVHHKRDGGRYITAAILVAKHPETGVRNVSIHRLQVLGPDKLGILILPRHLWQFFDLAEKCGRPLEVALAIGLHPLILLASQATTGPGVDELEIASALLGQPLSLVRCETVDLEVPAEAEIVLEGHLLPAVREVEGPFGEYPKYYGPASPKPVIKVTAICHRRDPVYHTIIPASREHLLLGAIPREAVLLQLVRQAVPSVAGVHLTPGGGCRYHAVVAIDKRHEGEAKNAIFAALASSSEVKRVVVVDRDVNISDPEEVEWAIATRCQAGRDVFVVTGALGNKLDPSSSEGISDKMGIDATIPLGAPPEKFERILIPGWEKVNLTDYFDD